MQTDNRPSKTEKCDGGIIILIMVLVKRKTKGKLGSKVPRNREKG